MRIRIAAPAIEGKANVAVEQFVAALFGLRTSAVTLVRGRRSRDKTLWVAGIAAPPPGLIPYA